VGLVEDDVHIASYLFVAFTHIGLYSPIDMRMVPDKELPQATIRRVEAFFKGSKNESETFNEKIEKITQVLGFYAVCEKRYNTHSYGPLLLGERVAFHESQGRLQGPFKAHLYLVVYAKVDAIIIETPRVDYLERIQKDKDMDHCYSKIDSVKEERFSSDVFEDHNATRSDGTCRLKHFLASRR